MIKTNYKWVNMRKTSNKNQRRYREDLMFTFITICYNQEKYIIEHLESIKYQIEEFGQGIKINLIISDDCSSDSTAILVKEWTKENNDIFNEVTININEENEGIVKNYLKATALLSGGKFKVLDGDDLYFKHNIFIAFESEDLLITPTIKFSNEVNRKCDYRRFFYILFYNKADVIKSFLKRGFVVDSPGTFINSKLIKNKNLRECISRYTWIEDYPQLYYLLNKVDNLKIKVSYTPLILYRRDSGVVKNKKNDKHNEFSEEEKKLKKDFKVKYASLPKYLDLNRYKFIFDFVFLIFSNTEARNSYKKFKIEMDNEIIEANKYIKLIKERASKAYLKNGEEDLYE